MGKNRTPKPIYDNLFVMNFNTVKSEIHYSISKWNEDGTLLSLLQKAKLGSQEPKKILDHAIQLFTKVGRSLEK